jgi:hypothetical protein
MQCICVLFSVMGASALAIQAGRAGRGGYLAACVDALVCGVTECGGGGAELGLR